MADDNRASFEQQLNGRFKGIDGVRSVIRLLKLRDYEPCDTGVQTTPYDFNFYGIKRTK